MSPITKISGRPGTVRSGSTITRPARSAGASSQRAAREAWTPAAQITVRDGTAVSPIRMPASSQAVTGTPHRTSAPSLVSARVA